jgi:membrane fusion protein (multidrug efflux system)
MNNHIITQKYKQSISLPYQPSLTMKKILLFSTVLFLAACSQKKDAKTELADLKKQQADINARITTLQAQVGTKDSVKYNNVSEVAVSPGNFTNYVQIQGKIDAQDNVVATPEVGGVITAINAKVGQHVGKGQVLVQLDKSVLTQQIAQADAQLNLNRTLFQRQKNLWDQKIGTEVQYLQAQTTLQSAEKQVAALRQQAAMYTIKSPINGTVDQMDLKLGQSVAPGLSGIRIVNADNLKVKADVPESYGSRINQGDIVKVVIPDVPDSVNAKVTFAAKVIDPSSRSFAIEVKLPSRKTLRPNMTATLKIVDYQKNNSLAVPLNAIQKSENGDYVFIDQGGIARRKQVKVGSTYGGRSEILSGISAGDKLITDGASNIEDGDHVKTLPNQ